MHDQPNGPEQHDDEIEYVGAPTEFANADEVPEWVANVAKVLFFLPSALITTSTIPFLFLAIIFACCMCLFAFSAAVGAV